MREGPGSTRVTTFIETVRTDVRTATVRVCGELHDEAALVLCELVLAHSRRGRRRVLVDVQRVSDARTTAVDMLAVVARGSTAHVTMTAFPPPVCSSLMSLRTGYGVDVTARGD